MDRILYINKSIGVHTDEIDAEPDNINESVEMVDDHDAVESTALKGTCISCMSQLSDIILLPCFDIVICSKCWQETKTNHERDCESMYKKKREEISGGKKEGAMSVLQPNRNGG